MIYQITAQLEHVIGGWAGSRQVPTFFLDSDVQGIVSAEHAERIAYTVVNPLSLPGITVHVTVHPVHAGQAG